MSRFIRSTVFFLLTFSLLLLSACGGGPTGPANGLSGSITFWMYQSDPQGVATMQQLKTKFQAANPGTTINIVPIPKDSFITKTTTAIATGTQPDAAFIDQPLIARYAEDKIIDPVPADLIDEDQFFQGALNTNRSGDELYGLPLSQTCVALYYNKDLVSTPPTTWEELLATAKQVANPEKQIAAINLPRSGDFAGWIFPGFVAAAGGTLLDEENKVVKFDDQPAVDALTLWKQLAAYSPPKILDATNSFETGHVAMLVSGPWSVSGFRTNFPDLNWGVTLLPKNKQHGTNIGGENSGVFSKSKNKALAWAWLKFLTEKENNITLNDKVTGNFPITIDAASPDNAWVKADPTRKIFVDQLEHAQARPTVPDWLKINDEILGKAIENTIVKGEDPKKSLTDATAQAKQVLGW